MEKEFVPYPEALELKELGFYEDSFRYYKNNFKLSRVGLFYKDDWSPKVAPELKSDFLCLAPTYSQGFRWFRKKYKISHSIQETEIIEGQTDLLYVDESEEFENVEWLARAGSSFIKTFKTYEEAELACLRKLIEIVKTKQ